MADEPNVILDTCCLINLAAADDLSIILPASRINWHIPKDVEAQGIAIRASVDPADSRRHPISLESAVTQGLLRRCDVDPTAVALFVELAAAHGDNADAAALTIAITHNLPLATDDQRLARLAEARRVRTLSTAAIMKRVEINSTLSRDDMRALLVRIEELGRWRPHKSDPDAEWWQMVLSPH